MRGPYMGFKILEGAAGNPATADAVSFGKRKDGLTSYQHSYEQKEEGFGPQR